VVHHVNQALRAHKLFQRDKDYIVKATARSSSSTSSPAA
jgi:preprotein translocase subunit SecA